MNWSRLEAEQRLADQMAGRRSDTSRSATSAASVTPASRKRKADEEVRPEPESRSLRRRLRSGSEKDCDVTAASPPPTASPDSRFFDHLSMRRSRRLQAIPPSLDGSVAGEAEADSEPEEGKRSPARKSSPSKGATVKSAGSKSHKSLAPALVPVSPSKRKVNSHVKNLNHDAHDEHESSSIDSDGDAKERIKRCPVPGCDSTGHLSGKYDQHLTAITCPLYHNLTPQDCIDRYQRRHKRRQHVKFEAESKPVLRKSPCKNSLAKADQRLHQLSEQRKKEMSAIFSSGSPKTKQAIPLNGKGSSGREPDLKGLTPIFDLDMFREAQSRAAEIIQEQMDTCASSPSSPKSPSAHHQLKSIVMGKYEMDIWYSAPYPDEYLSLPKLFICEFCLKYFNSPLIMKRHVLKCGYKYPPGDEIYRKGAISFFEVDGDKNKTYCQNLCLLAKLFLHHKTLYYDVEPFRFYIMTEADQEGFHLIGYFSKEKNSFLNYNVSCILSLPPFQKQGYGRMLIDFSYLLTKKEGKVGSPEKPLSDLGLISYRSYWQSVILEYLCNYRGNNISIRDLSVETAINAYDIVSTLQALGMLKYWKGKHLVLTKKEILDEFRAKLAKSKKAGNKKRIDAACLHWTPPSNSPAVGSN